MFTRVESFVHTAEKRSFRAAASLLGVTPTAVSKSVSALERELGVRLLNRTSRAVALTTEGEVYYRHCREALDRLQTGRDLVTEAASVAEGRLRVSTSFALGRRLVGGLPRLLSRFPGLQVHLCFSDTLVSLVDEDIDVALRLGDLVDSTLVGRRLRSPAFVTVAAPGYLAGRGEPRVPSELESHTCVQFARPSGQVAAWRFGGDEGPREWTARRPVLLDQGDLLVDAALAGVGVVQVFDFMVRDHLQRGDLVELLARRRAPGPPLHALCVGGRQRVPRIRAFVDFAAELFGEGG